MNPRGVEPFESEFPRASYEKGNAWRLGDWGKGDPPRSAPPIRQLEVQALFRYIADELDFEIQWDKLMDRTLTANLCPFASRSWEADFRKNVIVRKFCHGLWSEICTHLEPATVICLANDTFDEFKEIFSEILNVTPVDREPIKTGHGNTRYQIADVGDIMILKIPLYARSFQVMRKNDSKYVEPREVIVKA